MMFSIICSFSECVVHDVVAMAATSASSAPVFSRPDDMQLSRRQLSLVVGDSLTLPCYARASPTPLVAWYKNDVILDDVVTWSLELRHVTLADCAVYTCVVYNNVAAISFTYNVNVKCINYFH